MKERSAEFEQITQMLPDLTGAELYDLGQAIQGLLEVTGNVATTEEQSASDQIIDLVAGVMSRLGVDNTMPAILKRAISKKDFNTKSKLVWQWLERAHPDRAGRLLILRIAVECLYRADAKRGFMHSSRTMLENIHRVQAELNAQFPGYLEAGLMHMLVNSGELKGMLRHNINNAVMDGD